MPKYIVIVNGKKYSIWNNSKKYYVESKAKTEDQIILTFDEDRQLFVARVKNPSQHTKYLLSQGKLGFSICKCNYGLRDNWKHIPPYRLDSGMYYIDDETNEPRTKKDRTRYKYHPRWAKISRNYTEVADLTCIEISPNSFYWSNYNRPGNLVYTWHFIRGALVSLPPDTSESVRSSAGRAYKMTKDSLKIGYAGGNRGFVDLTDNSILDVSAVPGNNNTYTITINNITGGFKKMYERGQLMVGVKAYGPRWNAGSHGGPHTSNNRSNSLDPHRKDMWAERENNTRHYGHCCQNSIVSSLMFTFTPRQDIMPYETLTRMSDTDHHNTHNVKIEGTYEIYLYHGATGHKICTLVDNLPYTWYENNYQGNE